MPKVKQKRKITGSRFLTAVAAMLAMSFVLPGCSLPFSGGSGGGLRYKGEKGGEPVKMSGIDSFSFSYSSGSYMNSGSSYYATKTENGVEVTVRQDGIDIDDVPVILTDESFLDRIGEILKENHVDAWNGYGLSAQDVLDGDSFSISVAMDNGETLSAHGYEAWPDGYGSVRGALDALFVDLYESHYPNKQKALKAYFDELSEGSEPFSAEITLEYPYIRTGESQFEYGDPGLKACIIARVIGDFTGGDQYTNDPREMLIVRLYPEKAETEGFVKTVMSLELYRIDDDLAITKTGGTVIDEDVSSNEGIYGNLFVHEYEGQCFLGYNVVYNNKESVDDNAYLLRLFSFEDGSFEMLADEKVYIPDDRESVTIDDLSGFVNVAEKYGFPVSQNNWKEKPWDPMIDRYDRDRTIVELSTRNNVDKGFDSAFTGAPIGEKVGDYGISGTLKGSTWNEE